ncbi:unnamed protein product [Rhizophagus irregularis]|nr:unnamed protein product [Rhizophagus irregularis]
MRFAKTKLSYNHHYLERRNDKNVKRKIFVGIKNAKKPVMMAISLILNQGSRSARTRQDRRKKKDKERLSQLTPIVLKALFELSKSSLT